MGKCTRLPLASAPKHWQHSSDAPTNVQELNDGSIVEVGNADGSLLLARLNNNGSQDFSFNGGQSYRIFPFSAGASSGQGVIIDSSRPVIAGSVNGGSPGGRDLAILRLQSDLVFTDRFEPPQ